MGMKLKKNKDGTKSMIGRPKGALNKRTQQAIEIIDQAIEHYGGDDPLVFLYRIMHGEEFPQVTVTEEGEVVQYSGVAPLRIRLQAARELAQYRYPKLRALELTGSDQGPVEVRILE